MYAHKNRELKSAYAKTRYIVEDIVIQVGKKNEKLDNLLIENNCTTYAFITAYNPLSELLTAEQNELRHKQLINYVETRGYKFVLGYGEGTKGWPNEMSLLIIDISKEEAIACGIAFNQKAIIFGQLRASTSLLMLQ